MHRGRLSYAAPAAENPALLCLKKLTAKQEGSSRNGAGDMRHGHSETYRWQSSIQERDTFHLQHNLLLFIQNTATTTHPYKQEDRTVCVHVCIRWLVNYRTRWAIVVELCKYETAPGDGNLIDWRVTKPTPRHPGHPGRQPQQLQLLCLLQSTWSG